MKRAAAGVVMIGIALSGAVTACGNDGRTQQAFEDDVALVCDEHIERRGAVASEHFTSETEPPTAEQLQGFYADFAPAYASFVEALEDIEPADGREEDYDRLLVAVRRNAVTIEEAGHDAAVAERLLATDEAELHQPDDLAVDLGFSPEC